MGKGYYHYVIASFFHIILTPLNERFLSWSVYFESRKGLQ